VEGDLWRGCWGNVAAGRKAIRSYILSSRTSVTIIVTIKWLSLTGRTISVIIVTVINRLSVSIEWLPGYDRIAVGIEC